MFNRTVNPIMKKILNKQYESTINVENISSISSFRINKIFKDEEMKYREIILHNLINEWWIKSEQNEDSFKILKKIIRRSKIQLNQVEKHNIFLIEEQVFSIDRHIKILDVSNSLLKKESVGAKFVNASLYKKKNSFKTFDYGDLLITNRRILIIGEDTHAFFWINIEDIIFGIHGFEFSYKNKRFLIRIHDQVTLKNTIENFASKKVAKWNH